MLNKENTFKENGDQNKGFCSIINYESGSLWRSRYYLKGENHNTKGFCDILTPLFVQGPPQRSGLVEKWWDEVGRLIESVAQAGVTTIP